jgi:hypothetical protein
VLLDVLDDADDINDYVTEDENVEWNTNCWCMVNVCRLYW